MDYRKFLGRKESMVLPYFGGPSVDARDRRLRVAREVGPGWWQFEVESRTATPVAPAEPADLSDLPTVRGYLWQDRLVRERGVAELVAFLPAEEPAPFSLAMARRWRSGELIFESLEFDTEAITRVRRALEEGESLAHEKGVPAELRSAFALALLGAASRRLQIPFSPAEVRARLVEAAEGAAEKVLRDLAAERERYRREEAERQRRVQEQAVRDAVDQERERRRAEAEIAARIRYASEADRQRALRETARERIEAALEAAGGRLLRTRGLEADRMEVVWRIFGERFVSIVDGLSLQIIDSGICLGHPAHDQVLTLESLPGVIREAVETGRLVILRHDEGD